MAAEGDSRLLAPLISSFGFAVIGLPFGLHVIGFAVICLLLRLHVKKWPFIVSDVKGADALNWGKIFRRFTSWLLCASSYWQQ